MNRPYRHETSGMREDQRKEWMWTVLKSRKTLSGQVYEKIREKITSVEFPPGMVLQEARLASEFGVSRTPVRDAINLLVLEGWLCRDGRTLSVKSFTKTDICQIFEIRSILETAAVRKVFSQGNPRLLAGHLDDYVAKMTRECDIREFISHDIEFHAAIVKQMANPRLTQFWYNIYEEVFRAGLFTLQSVKNRKNTVINEHRSIVEYCWEKNLETTLQALKEHHDSSLDSLTRRLKIRKEHGPPPTVSPENGGDMGESFGHSARYK